ncbi:hypothetical protein [Vibrio atypicus]|uniref:hypothetical protein n=1 Tax=Vibrio atypicus TaxID=558271 RepID=UPI001359379A|nr:hypothetical protein [Vibrio atypicus]
MKKVMAGYFSAIILAGCKFEYTTHDASSLSYTSTTESHGGIDSDCIERTLFNDPQFESANFSDDAVIVRSNGFDLKITVEKNKLVIFTNHNRISDLDDVNMSDLSSVSENIKESLLHSCPLST